MPRHHEPTPPASVAPAKNGQIGSQQIGIAEEANGSARFVSMTGGSMCEAFGLAVLPTFPLPGLGPCSDAARHCLRLELASSADIAAGWSGDNGPAMWSATIDGRPFAMIRGEDGDHLFRWRGAAEFHLDAARRRLLCAPQRPGEMAWRRLLLDSVLFSVSLLCGYEALHGAAVKLPGKGVLALVGHSGVGKTTLLAELLRRGHAFYTDDVLALERAAKEPIAHPGPSVLNLDGASPTERIGRPLARFGSEVWCEVSETPRGPAPLHAICILERGRTERLQIERLPDDLLAIVPYTLGVVGTPAGTPARFFFYCDVVRQVNVFRLSAPRSVPPEDLANAVEAFCEGGETKVLR
jgi:hypothetical protein